MNGRYSHRRNGTADMLACGLGLFSIGLGLAELLAARRMRDSLGMDRGEGLLQLYGLREIASGIGILAAENRAPWVWGRVLGDVIDIASLAPGLHSGNPRRATVGAALGAVAAVTVLDLLCARQLQSEAEPPPPPRDYSDRSGFPDTPEKMRGAARR